MDFSALKVGFGFHVLPQNSKIKTQIRRAVSSFWLALTSSRPRFSASTFKMADELPWINRKNRCRIEESVDFDSCVMMMTCSKTFVSSSLCTSDVLRNVFPPWWQFYVYQEPLDRWEIFKELSTDSVFIKRIWLHRNVTSSSKCWKNWSPRNGVMDKTMTSSPWT